MRLSLAFLIVLWGMPVRGQTDGPSEAATLRAVLQRLDSLEQQNRELTQEVRSLRQELIASRSQQATSAEANPAEATSTQAASTQATSTETQPPLDERVTRNENRIDEQAQTKVEASHKLPIKITGMFLFNAFSNSKSTDNYTGYTELLSGPSRSGATLRQTLLGVQFQGPHLPGNGTVQGDLMMDFFSGSAYPGDSWLRLRRGVMSFDWPNRTFTVGQDKPLISPRAPNSLAEVGVPALAGAGNLWNWLPQVRYEERLHLGERNGITPQIALMETNESYARTQPDYTASLEKSRPSLEGRIAFWHKWDDTRRLEVAPGFHVSTTHVLATSVPSRVVSVDWLFRPLSKFEFSGTFFHGQNFAGLGALPQAFTELPQERVIPVHGDGGWVQLSSPITSRLTFNLFGGEQQNRARDLASGDVQRNLSYAANFMYRLGPNVLVGIEGLQVRTRLVQDGDHLQNHYDLSFAYLF